MLAHRRGRSALAAGPPRRGERGETLVELLTTVVIVGLAFGAVVGAMFTAASAAQLARERSQMSVALQSWADRTLAPAIPSSGGGTINYLACGTPPSGVPASGHGLPTGWSASWSVRYLEPSSSPTDAPDFTSPSWTSSCFHDRGLQEITMTVTGPRFSDSLVIYKRDPRCRDSFDNADRGPC